MTDWQDAVIEMKYQNKKTRNKKKRDKKGQVKSKITKTKKAKLKIVEDPDVGLRCWECGRFIESLTSGQLCDSCLIKNLKKIARKR